MKTINSDKLIEWIDNFRSGKTENHTNSDIRHTLHLIKEKILSLSTEQEELLETEITEKDFYELITSFTINDLVHKKCFSLAQTYVKQLLAKQEAENKDLEECCDEYAVTISNLRKEIESLNVLIDSYLNNKIQNQEEAIALPYLEKGDSIKIYGEKTRVQGFEVLWNDGLIPPRYELILLTDGRGDPFYRSLDKIEIYNPETRKYEKVNQLKNH